MHMQLTTTIHKIKYTVSRALRPNAYATGSSYEWNLLPVSRALRPNAYATVRNASIADTMNEFHGHFALMHMQQRLSGALVFKGL